MQVLHRSEVQEWQVRLEEAQEKIAPWIPSKSQNCDCLQVLHRSEVQEWQVRFEEAQEKLAPWIP